MKNPKLPGAALLLLLLTTISGSADEGMWLFNDPPRKMLQERYGFNLTEDWLDHVQRSCVRFNSGGSGSFVSKDGLLISNHHVGADAIQKLSSRETNYLRDGFQAKELNQELKCVDLELNVLQSIEDVTARVNAAVPTAASAAQAFAARRKVIAEIEKESLEQTGLRSDVITLWKGGAYHLYRFKRYTDVRLVFAPEKQIAFFGGDPDNFEFPRYDLDVCFFRAYENGRPAQVKNFLSFSKDGCSAGDLVIVAGHPGRTSRLLTVAELEMVRDLVLPTRLSWGKQMEVLLASWSARSTENARRAADLLDGVRNGRKARDGMLAGLLDPKLMASKAKAEADFKARLAGKPEWNETLAAYDRIADALKATAGNYQEYMLIEGGFGFASESFQIARTLARAARELPKPDGERLEEFSESSRVSLELDLFSPRPIYPDLEILALTHSLTLLANELNADSSLVDEVLAGKSPNERATELIQGTKVREVAFRRKIFEGGADAIAAVNDPMIELARSIDDEALALRRVNEEQDEVRQQAHAAISRARNAVLGTQGYPDATFTLRLSFGTVKGYEEQDRFVPPFTTYAGLYERAHEMENRPPFHLPAIWVKRKSGLDLKTPLNFVSTCDIIGGNSGSPVINRAGEFVGIIFDGNLASLVWDFVYTEEQGRATSVDSRAIVEALSHVYQAKELVRELTQGKRAR